MSDVASDRRRVPRAVIADTELSVLAFPIPVRLLDISLGGGVGSGGIRLLFEHQPAIKIRGGCDDVDHRGRIADSFAQASRSYQNNPTALHLRAMNMLYEGLKEKGALMLIPSSAVESMGMGGLMGAAALQQQRLTEPGPGSAPSE